MKISEAWRSEKWPREDGYELWLRYPRIERERDRTRLRESVRVLVPAANTPSLRAATLELQRGLSGLLGERVEIGDDPKAPGALLVGGERDPSAFEGFSLEPRLSVLGAEGYVFAAAKGPKARGRWALVANTDVGVLYGAYYLLRTLQTDPQNGAGAVLREFSSRPRLSLRILDHWDNLDGTVERGYAGASLWDWQKLPGYVDPRYEDYARACASVGLNGSVLTNVNSNALVLTEPYLEKVAALASVFRPYGVRVYLTARFSAPIELSGLDTADPLEPKVQEWWQRRVEAIYRHIPDFGGFAVKANSEGQPGPQNYGRSHSQGANLLANALAPHGGIVMWRAFVYDHEVPEDRAMQAHTEFTQLDGEFLPNVLVQVKNGPIDFQPREPHHPLIGAMPQTPLMLEFQLAQEYLGCATNLAYLGTLFKECLETDTYVEGKGSTVAKVVDGHVHQQPVERTGMAAVTNIGSDRNWCGHPFGASNWFAYGRLCWDHRLSAEELAREWVRMTFSTNPATVQTIVELMMSSREAIVDYTTPLGLHHQMAVNHHYGPGPWVDEGRPDWTSTYYHRADAFGLGFDRSPTGSSAVAQYATPLAKLYGNRETCPESLLLWFHHVSWDYKMSSGRTLWQELCHRYQVGVDAVRTMQQAWSKLSGEVDVLRFAHVEGLLRVQEQEARWWRDSCVLYFQTFSKRPVPEGYEPPEKTLEEYRAIRHYYVPGIPNPFIPLSAGQPAVEA